MDNKKFKKKVCTIGATRWWSKNTALTKIFENFNNPELGIFVDLLLTLGEITIGSNIKPEARFKTSGLKEGLCKYETVLTAQMYFKIFQKTTPLSKYLQGHGINIMTAYHMLKQTFEDLRKSSRDFSSIVNEANNFVEYTNTKLNEIDDNGLEISNCLPEIRQGKKTRQFIDYESNDESS